jgi:hypothetical protein
MYDGGGNGFIPVILSVNFGGKDGTRTGISSCLTLSAALSPETMRRPGTGNTSYNIEFALDNSALEQI